MKKLLMTVITAIAMSATANAALNTTTYVSIDGAGSGHVLNNGTGTMTLIDSTQEGDMWNNGDNFIYLHDSAKETGDFTATVRVVSQTEAVDGRWGKAGIRANASLDADSSAAMTQIAAGNGSQPGQANPVPARLAGRATNGTLDGGFENPILDGSGVEVPNDVFRIDGGVNLTWLSLTYTAADNAFVAGIAPDVDGAPGTWSYSDPKTDIEATGDGWHVGIAYSAHSDMADTADLSGFHGVTFDNYSIEQIPEPAAASMVLIALAGMVALRRRK